MGKAAKGSEAAAVWLSIDELEPWAKNPRRNEAAVEPVARAIIRLGWGAPLVAWVGDDRKRIIAGHTRRLASLSLPELWEKASEAERAHWHPDAVRTAATGLVPVRLRDDLTETDAAVMALADNKLNEKATWDDDLLAEVLADMDGDDIEIAGWDEDELDGGDDDGDGDNDDGGGESELGDNGYQHKDQFGVIVLVESEIEQEQVFNKLSKQGFKCRVVTV